MADWAEEKAREWLTARLGPRINLGLDEDHVASLAALLDEVVATSHENTHGCCTVEDGKRAMLAEVRRVVEELRAEEKCSDYTADEILARLEKR